MNRVDLPQKLRLPSHVIDFHCAQCGECCTNKWKIRVDAVSYDKLHKKFEELGRQKELEANIIQGKDGSCIRFLDNGLCPYRSDNNLCAIQLELGEEYLLDICKVYPRNIFASQHALEFSLFLTCKTAVKTLQSGPITFIESPLPILDSNNIPFSFMQPHSFRHYYPEKSLLGILQLPYNVLEGYLIKLIQDQRYTISQRLVAVGHALSHIISGNSANSNDVFQGLESIGSSNQFYRPEPDWNWHLEQLYFMSNIFLKKLRALPISQQLRSILLVLSSKKLQHNESGEGSFCSKVEPPSPSCYQKTLDQYYRPALSAIEPILENYMVNYILNKHFYLKPLHFAYYRMAFGFAAITAVSLGYSLLTNQPVTQHTTLQAVYDIENIFYDSWFYPYISFIQGGRGSLHVIESGLCLASL